MSLSRIKNLEKRLGNKKIQTFPLYQLDDGSIKYANKIYKNEKEFIKNQKLTNNYVLLIFKNMPKTGY